MNTLECIKTRRSRRLFLDKPVPDSLLRQLLSCAICAPSSLDCQPWHFVVVTKKETKEKLAELKEEGNKDHILTAPVLIVVCVDREKSPSRWLEDGVTATQNLLLAVHDLGLGAVYVTGFKDSKPEVAATIRKLLSLPKHIMPITVLPVGYSDPKEKLEEKNLINLDNILHIEKW